jgi:hypothetical protein
VLDFAFKQAALRSLASGQPTEIWREFLSQDVLYAGGKATARQLPTFLGNHDQGRFAFYVREGNKAATRTSCCQRVKLGHVLMFTWRGVPTVYYGDEQGFVGDGGDQDARETLFPSKTAVYLDNDLLGTERTNAQENFDTAHPLYRLIGELSRIRTGSAALRRGDPPARRRGRARAARLQPRGTGRRGDRRRQHLGPADHPQHRHRADITGLAALCGPLPRRPGRPGHRPRHLARLRPCHLPRRTLSR